MNLRALSYFLKAVELGSIQKAATVLHLTQPPVSRAIAALEKEVGVTLLQRGRHGVTPTAAGEHLVIEGAKLQTQLATIQRHLQEIENGSAGQLALAAIPSLTLDVLPELLSSFVAENPRVHITLSSQPPHGVVDALLNGDADVGILAIHRPETLPDNIQRSLNLHRLSHERANPLTVVLPRRLEHLPDPVPIELLRDETWIVPFRSERVPSIRELAEELWRSRAMPYPQLHEVSLMQVALPLIAAGVGVGLMPRTGQLINEPNLVLREAVAGIPELDLVLAWRRDSPAGPVTERFLRLANIP